MPRTGRPSRFAVERRRGRVVRLLATRASETPLEVKRLAEALRVVERTVRADLSYLSRADEEDVSSLRLPADLAAAFMEARTAEALWDVEQRLVAETAAGRVGAEAAVFHLGALHNLRQSLKRKRAEAPAGQFVAEGLDAFSSPSSDVNTKDSEPNDEKGEGATES